jgi:predicted Zn finger-like uncharacterized protein
MSIPVTCPKCEAQYKISEQQAGKKIKCKKCGAAMPIPSADDEPAEEGNKKARSKAGKKAKKGGSKATLAIVGGVVALLACCICLPGGVVGYGWWQLDWFGGQGKIAQKSDGPNADGKDGQIGKKGATILEDKYKLTSKDPPDKIKGKPSKDYLVQFEKGRLYVIDMKADKQGMSMYNPCLRIYDPAGKQVAYNDDYELDGKNFDAKIRFSARSSGQHTITATTLSVMPLDGLAYTLTVRKE